MRFAALFATLLLACGSPASKVGAPSPNGDWTDKAPLFPTARHQPSSDSLEEALSNPNAKPLAIVGATIMTATGSTLENATIVLENGAITALGSNVSIPGGAEVIDGKGRYVTPGIIDSHSHIGVYSSPGVQANSDGNEMVAPTTPYARARYGYWTQDPQITRARAGGVTTALILPGSANVIGGQGYTVVMRPGGVTTDHAFPGAPPTLKMACGENPKRVYGEKGGPQTRMGLYAHFRKAFHEAVQYNVAKQAYENSYRLWQEKKAKAKAGASIDAEAAPEPPATDLGLETLAAVLRGEIMVQVHCYRAGDIKQLVEVSDEFNFNIRSFHHAIEAYKVRDLLVEHDISISTWTDWWGFKMEAFDGIPENAALMTLAGGRAIIHSDSAIDIQHLNHEAAKGMYAGRAAGMQVTEDQALRWITANPAWALGIDKVTGTLEPGKRADLVLWSGHPFSVYSLADLVIQAGEIGHDRSLGLVPTDFELGNSAVDADATQGESQ